MVISVPEKGEIVSVPEKTIHLLSNQSHFFGQALPLGGFKVRHALCKHTSEYNVLGLFHVNTLGVLRF